MKGMIKLNQVNFRLYEWAVNNFKGMLLYPKCREELSYKALGLT